MREVKLNLGCGASWKHVRAEETGFGNLLLSMDIENFGQEIVRDVNKGIPFTDWSLDEVICHHTLEHIRAEDLPFVMSEIGRVLKFEGLLIATMPHANSDEALDVAHFSLWNEHKVKSICNNHGFACIFMQHVGMELRFILQKIEVYNSWMFDPETTNTLRTGIPQDKIERFKL